MIGKRLWIVTLALASLGRFSVAQNITLDFYATCIQALRKADVSANNQLNKDPEYILFLRELAGDEFFLTTYANLPEALRVNFEIYESDGAVDIRGATRGDSATRRQKRVVGTLCETTFLAIDAVPADDPSRTFNMNSTAFNATTGLSNLTFTESTESTDDPSTESTENTSEPTSVPNSTSVESTSSMVTSTVNETEEIDNAEFGSIVITSGPVTRNTTRTRPTAAPTSSPPTTTTTTTTNTTTNTNTNTTTPTTAAPTTTTPATAVPTTAVPTGSRATTATATAAPTTATPTSATTSPDAGASSLASNASNTSAPTVTAVPIANMSDVMEPSFENSTNHTYETEIPTQIASESPSIDLTATSDPSTSDETSSPSSETTGTAANGTKVETNANSTVTEANATTDDSQDFARTNQPSSALTSVDPFSDCKKVMTFSDIDEDGALTKKEYVWFLSDNWDDPFPGMEFKDLPQSLQDNFFSFAIDGQIDVSMASLPEDITAEQDDFLDMICNETTYALAEESESANAGDEANMATFEECLMSVIPVDANGDSFMDEAEYVSLIRMLTKSKFGESNFESLPEILQDNFRSLTDNATIDLAGAKLGEELLSSQQETLDQICVDTSYALNEAYKAEGELAAGFDTADTDTMLEYSVCFMQISDEDLDQDSRLDEKEYAGLVNRMGKDRFQDLNFTELPATLRDNFLNLENNGSINIAGSKADQVLDEEQQQHLVKVCIETTAAVNMELELEEAKQTSPPSIETGISEATNMGDPLVIHSSFNIYSDISIPDNEFMLGSTKTKLQDAYKLFVMDVVNGLSQNGSTSGRNLRRRRLQEGTEFLALLDENSPTLNHIVDLACAGASPDAICRTVFAQYEIFPVQGSDREELYDEYVRVTQKFIDDGMLQKVLERIHPDTVVAVIGASEPVVYHHKTHHETSAPNSTVPTGTEYNYEQEAAKSKKKTIALIAVAVGCLLVASLIGLIGVQLRKRRVAAAAAATTSAKGGSASSTSDSSAAKDADTASKDEFHQETTSQSTHASGNGGFGSSLGSHGSSVFRGRRSTTAKNYDDHMADVDIGKMQIVDLCESVNAANEREALTNSRFARNLARQEDGESLSGGPSLESAQSFPPLRRERDFDVASTNSDDISFAFRRFAIDGEKKKTKSQFS